MDNARTRTRADLVQAIHREVGLSQNECADLLEDVLEVISEALVSGEPVKISRFGSFRVREKRERMGRNPRTGEPATITERRVLTFRPSSGLRKRIFEKARSVANCRQVKKSRTAYRTISEVEALLSVQAHVLRYWESQFAQIDPVKRAGNRRYYRPSDIELIAGIRKLLHDDGLTIRGVKKILHEKGVQHVAALVPSPLNHQDANGGGPEETETPNQDSLFGADAADAATPTEKPPSSKQIAVFGQVVHLSEAAVRGLDSEGRRALVRCYDRLEAIRDRLSERRSALRTQTQE